MKAWGADKVGMGIDAFSQRDIPAPTVNAGSIRIDVHAVALNSADLKVADWRDGASFIHAKASPYVPGYDFSGVVEAVGSGVTDIAVGEAVFGFLPYAGGTKAGSLAEQVVILAANVAKKPPNIDHAHAAALGTAAVTALQGLRDKLRLTAGQRVLVYGASGGVGTFAVQVAKQLGLSVVATSSPAKAAIVEHYAPEAVIDHRSTPVTSIDGVFDGVFDAACKTSYGACKSKLTPEGGYLTLLPSPSFITGKIASLFSRRHVEFLSVKSVRADLEQLASWASSGDVTPHIGLEVTFDDAPQAFAAFAEGKTPGKIVITVVD